MEWHGRIKSLLPDTGKGARMSLPLPSPKAIQQYPGSFVNQRSQGKGMKCKWLGEMFLTIFVENPNKRTDGRETKLVKHGAKTACPRSNLHKRTQIQKILRTIQSKDNILLFNSREECFLEKHCTPIKKRLHPRRQWS